LTECRRDRALDHCEARRQDSVLSGQKAFTPDHIRWACADVEGVNTNFRDDRGQEYCEYYAIVQPPPGEDGKLPKPVDLGRNLGQDTTDLGVELSQEQLEALEDEPDKVVGACVFTSWHSDVNVPLPICDGSTCPQFEIREQAELPSWAKSRKLGFKLTGEFAQMQISINSNGAASDLVDKCLRDPLVADAKNKKDPLHDDYVRGCMKSFELFGTEWRRSDPTICAVSARLSECGCAVDSDGDGKADITQPNEIAFGVVPPQPQKDENGKDVVKLRGFPLGTWGGVDKLPSGCSFVDTGDSSQTLVVCDLSAGDLLASKNDPKGRCREKYGDNVVVHLPIPAPALVCEAPEDGAHTDNCGVRPWEIGNEGAKVEPEPGPECCRTCGPTSKACGDACIPRANQCSAAPGCACNAEPPPSGS
jgi:hypothetical protein